MTVAFGLRGREARDAPHDVEIGVTARDQRDALMLHHRDDQRIVGQEVVLTANRRGRGYKRAGNG